MSVPDQDRYRTWDAAYLLGALSPQEQQEYEDHLPGCPACQRAVAEVADLPDLLALARPPVPSMTADSADVLELGGRPPRRDGRASWPSLLVWVGAVAAGVGVLVGGLMIGLWREGWTLGQPEAYQVAFLPVTPNAMTGVVQVIPHQGGTTLQVECQYGSRSDLPYARAHGEYKIYVVDRSGNHSLAKTWYAQPDKKMRPSAESPLPIRRIEAVEIWGAQQPQPLLRATLR